MAEPTFRDVVNAMAANSHYMSAEDRAALDARIWAELEPIVFTDDDPATSPTAAPLEKP